MLADVLSLPVEHRLAEDAILDVRIVVQRLGDDLSVLEETVETQHLLDDRPPGNLCRTRPGRRRWP
jgi:hypothetical protein